MTTERAIALGITGVGVVWVLFQNAANVGVSGGLMFGAGKGDLFLGLLAPHGLLELTAVFLAVRAASSVALNIAEGEQSDPGTRRARMRWSPRRTGGRTGRCRGRGKASRPT